MNRKGLKPGIALTCKPGTVIGYFTYSKSDIPYIVISHKTSLFHGPHFHKGENEILMYIGSREDTTDTKQMTLFLESTKKILEIHEVFWRGSLFRIREGALKYLCRLR